MCATLMTVHALSGERGAVEEVYRAGVELCREQSDDRVISELHATAAELRALRGETDAAYVALEQSLVGQGWWTLQRQGILLAHLALVAVHAGHHEKAQTLIDDHQHDTSHVRITIAENVTGRSASARA